VSDCFLILLHQDDVNGIAEEYPELMARFIGLRKLGQRKARDYNKATAEMYTSTILDSTDLFSKVWILPRQMWGRIEMFRNALVYRYEGNGDKTLEQRR
jgi:hypothetical protein